MPSTGRVRLPLPHTLLLVAVGATLALVLGQTPAIGQAGGEGGGGGDCPQSSVVIADPQADPDLAAPVGVDVDDDGQVYVADRTTNTVYRFNPDGTQTLAIPAANGDPDLIDPTDVAVLDDGTMWVADDGTNRIHRFNASGTQIDVIGPAEATPDFQKPEGIAVDGAGTRLWVTDPDTGFVYRFDAAGNQTASFPESNADPDPSVAIGMNAIAIDPTGDVVLTDQGVDSVYRFNADGTQDRVILPAAGDPDLLAPVGVAVDAGRNIWVVDQNVDGVYRFGAGGTQKFFIDGAINGGLSFARRLALGRQGDLWATDEVNDAVFRWCFRPDGRIQKGAGAFVGDDVVNTTGANQTRTAGLGSGGSVTFTVRIDNDGNAHDQVTIRGTGGDSRFRVRYAFGGQNVTSAVVNGTFRTPSIIPGRDRALTVVVDALPGSPSGSSRTLSIRLTSFGASPRVDVVKAVVNRT